MSYESMKKYWEDSGIAPVDQYIVSAACKFGPVILCGARHFDSVMRTQIDAMGGSKALRKLHGSEDQGFIDQFGTYLSREDALAIVLANGQRFNPERNGSTDELYSEGLY